MAILPRLAAPTLCWTLSFFLVSASEVQEPVPVIAEPGKTVTLPCRAPNNIPIIVVEWTKPDLGSQYVYMYRDEQPDPENQLPSYQNRVELENRQLADGDMSLVLKNVTRGDGGRYECHIIQKPNRRKRASFHTEPINIISLDVRPPGHTAGPGKKGWSRGHGGVVACFVVGGIVVAFAFLSYMKLGRKNSHIPPDEQQP